MNILVTGGLGHIGSRLIRDFAKRSDIEKVKILDNLSTQRYSSLFNLPKNIKYEFIEGDILNDNDLNMAINGCDVVIHLAAITNAPESFGMKDEVNKVNVNGTEKVVQAALKHRVKKLIYPSTTSVYGPINGIAREDCQDEDLKPQSPYAETKLMGEKIVLKAAKENGLNSTVIRCGTIFGTSPGMRFHTVVNKFVFLACKGDPLTVWDTAINQKRPYLDLRDCIRAINFMIDSEKTKGELFNVVTINATVQEIVDAIKEFIPGVKIKITKTPLLNQVSYVTDGTKLINMGFKYEGNLKEAVRKTVDLLK